MTCETSHLTNSAIQCFGKEQYASFAMAMKVLKRRNRAGRTLNVYKCPHCRAFHHGKRP